MVLTVLAKVFVAKFLRRAYSPTMNTLHIDIPDASPDLGPACNKCGGRSRLVGIEPHPTRAHTDLRTYECLVCDAMQTRTVSIEPGANGRRSKEV